MISEEYDHGILIRLREIIDQSLQGGIGLFYQRQIHRQCLGINAVHGDIRGKVVEFLFVTAVILHGYVKDKQRLSLFFILIQFDDLGKAALIGDIVTDSFLIREIILGYKLIKTKQRIDSVSVPAAGIIRMDRHSMIVQFLQIGCQRRHLLLHILLISHAALR